MLKIDLPYFCALLILSSIASDVFAKTYKCIDENGDVTYSQIVCRNNQKIEKVVNSRKKKEAIKECKYAGLFAKSVIRQMRSGLGANQILQNYGGTNSVSKSTLGVINYVYSYKYTPETPETKIASLTITRCNARAFGKVTCEGFPAAFQYQIYGCDEEKRKQEVLRLRQLDEPQNTSNHESFDLITNIKKKLLRDQEALFEKQGAEQKRKKKEIQKCKRRFESEMGFIEKRMRQGYSASEGEYLRNRRKQLRSDKEVECP